MYKYLLGYLMTTHFHTAHMLEAHHNETSSSFLLPSGNYLPLTLASEGHAWTIGARFKKPRTEMLLSSKGEPISNISEIPTIAARQKFRPGWLRILPLGASIVRGWASDRAQTDGFRNELRIRLRADCYKVNMVGSL